MKLGLLTDIHNDAVQLRRAIELLLQSGVEQFVTIGDSFDPLADPAGINDVAELLMAHSTQGVWGNHDFAFCVDTPAQYTERYTPKLFEVTRHFTPVIERHYHSLGHVRFSHRECYVDPYDPLELWDLTGDETDHAERAQLALAQSNHAVQFVGHYHQWLAFNRHGKITWNGREPLHFDPAEKYFVVVHAVRDGWCGLLDCEQRCLVPMEI